MYRLVADRCNRIAVGIRVIQEDDLRAQFKSLGDDFRFSRIQRLCSSANWLSCEQAFSSSQVSRIVYRA